MSNTYWADRQERELNKITNRTEKEITRQLNKYYVNAMKQVIKDFEAVYDKLQATMEAGKTPTVADLYSLDRYWQMQTEIKNICKNLGDKEIELLSKKFEQQWKEIYEASALPSQPAFAQISTANAEQAIQSVWAGDGRTFSQRVWKNVNYLVDTLNEQLVNCVTTGRSTSDLRKALRQRFGVSLNQANMLIRTEVSHIQNESSAKRYQDSGLTEYKFLGRGNHEKELKCKCKELDGKTFSFAEKQIGVNFPPMHPNCRCNIKPLIKFNVTND